MEGAGDDTITAILAREPTILRALVLVSKRFAVLSVRTLAGWQRAHKETSDTGELVGIYHTIYNWTELNTGVGDPPFRHGSARVRCTIWVDDRPDPDAPVRRDISPNAPETYDLTVTYCLGRRVGKWRMDVDTGRREIACGATDDKIIVIRDENGWVAACSVVGGYMSRQFPVEPGEDIHAMALQNERGEDTDDDRGDYSIECIDDVAPSTDSLEIYLRELGLDHICAWV